MTELNAKPKPGAGPSNPGAPAASLTRVSIKKRVADVPFTESVAPEHTPEPPVIEATQPSRPGPEPVSARVFPSARPQPQDAAMPIPANEYQPVAPAEPARTKPTVAPSAIIDLWEHLAANRLRPQMSDIDPVAIASQWPNSLLLRVTETGRRPGMEVAHMFAPTAGGPTAAIPIDAMTVDWIIGLGREVVVTGGPVHETDAVPTGDGPIACGVIALPFGPEAAVDHVLCHLYRVDDGIIEGDVSAGLGLPPNDRTGIKRLFGR